MTARQGLLLVGIDDPGNEEHGGSGDRQCFGRRLAGNRPGSGEIAVGLGGVVNDDSGGDSGRG